MDQKAILISKVAALKKNFDKVDYGINNRAVGKYINPLFDEYFALTEKLREQVPELYSDLRDLPAPKPLNPGASPDTMLIVRDEVNTYTAVLEYILEVNANARIGENREKHERPDRIFISHGRSKEWYKVQSFIEKTLKHDTLELAQEPSRGRVVLQKLAEESDRCGIAVIVMTGDDLHGDEVRARENVMHEIGFFQGKYGLDRVILLHEVGVNIPSNIDGLVYVSFPKDTVEASFGGLVNELKVLIP